MPVTVLRSRIVLPLSREPIENGALVMQGDRIVAVERFSDLDLASDSQVIDLGESILLPGLINCHCHLDYTGMAGMIPPRNAFSDWIKSIIAIKATWSYTEFAASWVAGAHMLESSGVTAVVDIEAVPELLPDSWLATRLRIWSCLELINIRSASRPDDLVQAALNQARSAESNHSNRCGLSPHALYTTTSRLRQRAQESAKKEDRLLTTHVAESTEETAMYQHKQGRLYDWLSKQGDPEFCGSGSPVEVLEQTGYLDESLIIAHANELVEADIEILSHHPCHVVHCPRSHDYFNHSPFQWQALEAAGVNVTIGTDSLASMLPAQDGSLQLDLFAEFACLLGQSNAPSPRQVLKWATVNGAKAIGMSRVLGALEPNFLADVIVVPYSGSLKNVYEGVVTHSGPVSQTYIGGELVPQHSNTANRTNANTAPPNVASA